MKIGAVDRQQEANQNGARRHDEHDDNRLDRALLDALRVARAEILRRKAGHRRAETVERRHQQVIDLVCRTETVLRRIGDHRSTQHIKLNNDALHHNDADRQHGKLKAERDALDQMEGKVALRNGIREMPELYLTPDEKMVLNKVTGQMVKSSTRAAKANVWINDELFFDEELLEDIAKKLMRSYNVKVEVADSLRNKRFYGSFGISANTIDKILDVMASTQQMNYKYENGVYILY